jgi:hypothetical protein
MSDSSLCSRAGRRPHRVDTCEFGQQGRREQAITRSPVRSHGRRRPSSCALPAPCLAGQGVLVKIACSSPADNSPSVPVSTWTASSFPILCCPGRSQRDHAIPGYQHIEHADLPPSFARPRPASGQVRPGAARDAGQCRGGATGTSCTARHSAVNATSVARHRVRHDRRAGLAARQPHHGLAGQHGRPACTTNCCPRVGDDRPRHAA